MPQPDCVRHLSAHLRNLMKKRAALDKLAVLRRADHFRDWHSLDDERLCVVCGKTFDGNAVVVAGDENTYELHCPTLGCHSHPHQWVYPGNPLLNETADADWWNALGGSPADLEAQTI